MTDLQYVLIIICLVMGPILVFLTHLDKMGFRIPQVGKYRCIYVFARKLKAAKNASERARRGQSVEKTYIARYEVYKALENMKIDPQATPTVFLSAPNLQDAVEIYLRYDNDKFTFDGILLEVIGAYWVALGHGDNKNE